MLQRFIESLRPQEVVNPEEMESMGLDVEVDEDSGMMRFHKRSSGGSGSK